MIQKEGCFSGLFGGWCFFPKLNSQTLQLDTRQLHMTIGGASLILHIQYTWLDYYVWIRCLKCWKISGTWELTWVRRVLLVQMIRYRFPVIHWLIQNIWEQGIENKFDLFTATCEIESNKVHLLMKQMWKCARCNGWMRSKSSSGPNWGAQGFALECSDSIRFRVPVTASPQNLRRV